MKGGDRTASSLGEVRARGYFLLFLVLYGGVFAGLAFQSRTAAYVALAGFLTTLTVHVLVAVVYYRQVMRREWPKVAPLADDDDWDP